MLKTIHCLSFQKRCFLKTPPSSWKTKDPKVYPEPFSLIYTTANSKSLSKNGLFTGGLRCLTVTVPPQLTRLPSSPQLHQSKSNTPKAPNLPQLKLHSPRRTTFHKLCQIYGRFENVTGHFKIHDKTFSRISPFVFSPKHVTTNTL